MSDPYLPELSTPVIKTSDEIDTDINHKQLKELKSDLRDQVITQLRTPTRRTGPRKGAIRNDPCPCGSGRKYKKCCINK